MAKFEALTILTRLLHKDLADDHEIMPREAARHLSETFLAPFDDSTTGFYTNIDFATERQISADSWAGPHWKPVTDATFDAGVIAIAPNRAACLWVGDED